MKFEVKELKWDEYIWPRDKKTTSTKTVEAYTQSLKAGANFPPIEVQRVSNYNGETAVLILDGVHRWQAHGECEEDVIEGTYWKEKVLDYEENKIDLLARSASLNKQHGDRTDNKDKEATAKRIAEDDPEGERTLEWISESIGAPKSTVHDWITAIRNRQRASRNNVIYRLYKMGWRQNEIAEHVDGSQSNVSEIIGKSETGNIDILREQGKAMSEVAELLGIDLTLAWAHYLDGKTDDERMDALDITTKKYTVWNYTDAHDLMGRESFSGRIPGQIVMNALYWFTMQGDLVIDPMAGSGTTIDACLLMGRNCYAYDIEPFREDILKNNMMDGYPEEMRTPDFIFVDPPYWNIKNYGQDYTLEDFYGMLEVLAAESYEALKDGGRMGVLMGNQSAKKWLPEGTHRLDHVQKEHEIFTRAGFEKRWGIHCPLPTQGAQRWADAEWKNHRMGEITRELTIWMK